MFSRWAEKARLILRQWAEGARLILTQWAEEAKPVLRQWAENARLIRSPVILTTPADVNRYLLPDEHVIATVRQHPAVLTMSSAAALGGLLAAIAVNQIPHSAGSAKLVVWILTGFLVIRLILNIRNWMVYYVVVTEDRLVTFSGVFNRTVVVIRLPDLENITLERSSTGRLTGHGSLTIGPGGAPQTVIDYIPYPDQFYLEIRKIISVNQGRGEG